MTDEPRPPGPATGAMRLRAARRLPTAAEAEEITAIADDGSAEILAELLELHTCSPVVDLCRECLLPPPCLTRRLLDQLAGTATPPGKGSQ